MNQSFGTWMLTGGTRSELNEEARQAEHLHAFRAAQAERRATRRAERASAVASVVESLRTRFALGRADATPDCCPA